MELETMVSERAARRAEHHRQRIDKISELDS
jgi:hypothetical protein